MIMEAGLLASAAGLSIFKAIAKKTNKGIYLPACKYASYHLGEKDIFSLNCQICLGYKILSLT